MRAEPPTPRRDRTPIRTWATTLGIAALAVLPSCADDAESDSTPAQTAVTATPATVGPTSSASTAPPTDPAEAATYCMTERRHG